jgi:5-aminopentanamidase
VEQDLQTTRIAAAQFNIIEGDKKSNLNKALGYIRSAAESGAKVVLLPEMFLTGYPIGKPMADLAEPLEGESLQSIKDAASEMNIAVVGSYPEWDKEDNCSYNTAFFIGDDGKVLGKYRKIHLFDREDHYVGAGRNICVVDYHGFNYGLLICFDLEFPEPARALAMAGAQILLVVSANMDPYSMFHRIFAQARAIENHLYVAYCNRTGSNNTYHYCGDSCLVNPIGEIVSEMGKEEGLLVGDILLAEISKSKTIYDYLKQRRLLY